MHDPRLAHEYLDRRELTAVADSPHALVIAILSFDIPDVFELHLFHHRARLASGEYGS